MKILTVENLEEFCRTHKLACFSSKETGYQLCVHMPVNYKIEKFSENDQMLYAWTKLFHTGKNRNKSFIDRAAAEKAAANLAYKPILANFIETEDGELDFSSHDFFEDENGNVVYQEKPVGCFMDEDVHFSFDDETENEFVFAKIAIPKEYTHTADILKRKGGSKISMEAIVNEMIYNEDEKAIQFTDFEIKGATLLGDHIEEGMKGAKVCLEDFKLENNSVLQNVESGETQEFLNSFEASDAACQDMKGGNDAMDGAENKAVVESKEEVVVENTEIETEAAAEVEETEPAIEETESVDDAPEKTTEEEMSADDTSEEQFELSVGNLLQKVRKAVNKSYGYPYELVDIFNEKAVLINYSSGDMYAVAYTISENENVEFAQDMSRIYQKYLTKEEVAEFDNLRAELETTKAELHSYKLKEENARKDEILADPAYALYLEEPEFVEVIANRDNYTAEEFDAKAESAFAKCVKRIGHTKRKKKSACNSYGFSFKDPNVDEEMEAEKPAKKAYGGIFDKKK